MEFSEYIEKFYNSENKDRFYSPSKIHWGIGIARDLAILLRNKRITFFIDTSIVENSVVQLLVNNSLSSSNVIQIHSPPSPEKIKNIVHGGDLIADIVVAIGGGSTIDTAKCCIAEKYFGEFDGLNLNGKRPQVSQKKHKPYFIALPSTAGTGAETSRYYVTYRELDTYKVHGKSWLLTADMVFLDPTIAKTAPSQVLIESAFDAFIHLSESSFCMKEGNWVNNTICTACLSQLRAGLDDIFVDNELDQGLLKLLCAASFAGVAISNVRTGHIHEMSGAFLEKTGLTHPQSLAVFWLDAFRHINNNELGHTKIQHVCKAFGSKSFDELEIFWQRLFEIHGVSKKISDRLSAFKSQDFINIEKAVIRRTLEDSVWVTKECPVPLDEDIISEIFQNALARILTAE